MAAFVISALWHGMYSGYYVSLCSVPLYLAVEDIYDKEYRNYADSAGVSLFSLNTCMIILSKEFYYDIYTFASQAVCVKFLTLIKTVCQAPSQLFVNRSDLLINGWFLAYSLQTISYLEHCC